jgi:ABC-type proline/glycine betaine transport system permease subunit
VQVFLKIPLLHVAEVILDGARCLASHATVQHFLIAKVGIWSQVIGSLGELTVWSRFGIETAGPVAGLRTARETLVAEAVPLVDIPTPVAEVPTFVAVAPTPAAEDCGLVATVRPVPLARCSLPRNSPCLQTDRRW